MRREQIDLSGPWRFQADPLNAGERLGYAAADHDDAAWRRVDVPCCFDSCVPGLQGYLGVGWFRREVVLPAGWRGRRILLHFNGVNDHARVWVNGRFLGHCEDGFLPFEYPIHDQVEPGRPCTIAVAADNIVRKADVPGDQRGWRGFGGIVRDVQLVATAQQYIKSVRVTAEPRSDGGTLQAHVALVNDTPDMIAEATLECTICDAGGRAVVTLAPIHIRLAPGAHEEVSFASDVPGALPWSPAAPNLYTLDAGLSATGGEVDAVSTRFGFRRIEARGTRLLLNGEPIFLTGWNRHEDSPRTDLVPDLDLARWDLMEMKGSGANFVRLCHYPHHPAEVDLCDEIGLLVMDEIPLYWWKGNQDGEENCRAKLAAARRQVRAMVERDINHPSVIFWSVSNENHEQHPEVVAGNKELIRLARELDDTRLCVHVSYMWTEHPAFDEDDVLCLNAYPSLTGAAERGAEFDLSDSTQWWRENLERVHALYPDKPIVITEFGSCSLEGTRAGAYGEETAAAIIEVESAGMDAPYVRGAIVWCWADHAWPPLLGFQSLAVSPFGVLTRERKPKAPFHTCRRLFKEKSTL